jgi:hypothetical protein
LLVLSKKTLGGLPPGIDAADALVYLILGVAGDGIEQPKVHYVG